MRVLDLFSGIGGISRGLELAGDFETVGFCEIDPFCRAVLRKHWDVEIFDDITDFKYTQDVDLVTAGFPCQDTSHAGNAAGISGPRSGLFWYILRAIRLVGRPRLLLENVAGLLDRGMGTVQGALASLGYDTEWHCISASHVGAPHDRPRVFIIADAQRSEWRPESYGGAIRRMGRKQQSFPWDRPWQDAITEFRRVDDGLSGRLVTHRTDALRNSVVPQVVEVIGRAIMECEL